MQLQLHDGWMRMVVQDGVQESIFKGRHEVRMSGGCGFYTAALVALVAALMFSLSSLSLSLCAALALVALVALVAARCSRSRSRASGRWQGKNVPHSPPPG